MMQTQQRRSLEKTIVYWRPFLVCQLTSGAVTWMAPPPLSHSTQCFLERFSTLWKITLLELYFHCLSEAWKKGPGCLWLLTYFLSRVLSSCVDYKGFFPPFQCSILVYPLISNWWWSTLAKQKSVPFSHTCLFSKCHYLKVIYIE